MKRRGLVAAVAVLGALAVAGCAATTDPPSDVTASSAVLQAKGRTDSTPAHYYFQYSVNPNALGTGFGQQTPTRGPIPAGVQTSGGGLVPFSEAVSGLKPATTYYYQVCGGDGQTSGDVCAQIRSFTTADGVVFDKPGTYSWTVPAGVSQAMFDVYGAGGGQGGLLNISTGEFAGAGLGGLGAHVRARMSVQAGQTLTIVVGGRGADVAAGCVGGAGGANGGAAGGGPGNACGGGGGGASDVRTGPGDTSGLSTRLLAAGGGGGGAMEGRGFSWTPAAGGNGDLIGHPGQASPQGGGGGSATAGGAGGQGDPNGSDGALGVGGAGAVDPRQSDPWSGGGGAGGLYGGGGGGGGAYLPGHEGQAVGAGAGGGGSSLATTNTGCQATVNGGVQSGDGAVTITYNPGSC
jgi:hypothetical protein